VLIPNRITRTEARASARSVKGRKKRCRKKRTGGVWLGQRGAEEALRPVCPGFRQGPSSIGSGRVGGDGGPDDRRGQAAGSLDQVLSAGRALEGGGDHAGAAVLNTNRAGPLRQWLNHDERRGQGRTVIALGVADHGLGEGPKAVGPGYIGGEICPGVGRRKVAGGPHD